MVSARLLISLTTGCGDVDTSTVRKMEGEEVGQWVKVAT